MKKLAALVVIAAAVCFAWHYLYPERAAEPEAGSRVFGNVEMREVRLAFRVGGRLVRLMFEEGERASSGDLIAELDDEPYRIAVREAEAAAAVAGAALGKMRAGYQAEDIRAARAVRGEAAVALRRAESDLARYKILFSENMISRKEFDDITAARDAAREELAAADSKLSLLAGGFRSEDIEAAAAQLELARSRVAAANTALADTRLYAPADGTISVRVLEPGAMAPAAAPVVSMLLASPLLVRAYVAEPQLGLVKLGDKGMIYTDSRPDEPLEGVVSFIADDAEFTPKQVQTESTRTNLVYRIRLTVPSDPDGILKNGMPVTVVLCGTERASADND